MLNAKFEAAPGARSVRKIGVKTEHVRGRIAQNQEYESLLERDFMTLLRMDRSVASFVAQPVVVRYLMGTRDRSYVPDVLVRYKPDSQGAQRPPSLVEVKPWEFLDPPDAELTAKFTAAQRFCAQEGWKFLVVSERDIDTPRLANASFLLRYVKRECDPAHKELLLEQLELWNGCATASALLAGVFRSRHSQAELLPDLWTLVAQGGLFVDLDAPLNMNSQIWLV
jgi:hypothetical protein